MKLFTKEIVKKLRANAENEGDHWPVCKIFNPYGAATWLLTEMDEDGRCYGLCFLGYQIGEPELGYVMRDELEGYRNNLGLGLERDLYWDADRPLSAYADEAHATGRIAA